MIFDKSQKKNVLNVFEFDIGSIIRIMRRSENVLNVSHIWENCYLQFGECYGDFSQRKDRFFRG